MTDSPPSPPSPPASHHWLGTGAYSDHLAEAMTEPEDLTRRVADMVAAAGLGVVESHRVAFEGGGQTLVWILAESHLVLHYWHEEGFVTVDLHICDYRESNAAKADRLQRRLDTFLFRPGRSSWREIELPRP